MNNTNRITPLTVTQLNNQVKTFLEHQYCKLNVTGEINQLNKHSSGHVYFKLKDELSSVPCVMFNSSYKKNNINIQEGDKVVVSGSATLYLARGVYQLTINSIKLFDDKGEIYKKYEELKKKLQLEGLFDNQHKKELPTYPLRLGVITSLDGSVIKDIQNVCSRRSRNVDLVISSSSVQGEEAPLQLIEAINNLVNYNKNNIIDIIIIARGGGSFEDLNCFNDEQLAKKIFEIEIPVVSAVGHETDFTIADFVSDVRASTPSVAAELCVPDDKDVFQNLDYLSDKIFNRINTHLGKCRQNINLLSGKVELRNPKLLIDNYNMKNKNIKQKIIDNYKFISKNLHDKINYYDKLLNSNNPYNILDKGFTVVTNENNELIKTIKNIKLDNQVNVRFSDGSISAKVESKKYKDEK